MTAEQSAKEFDLAPSTSIARRYKGRVLVAAMLALGAASTVAIWSYWKFHYAPFVPLRKALDEAFPESVARVDGGRHKGSPLILRVVLTVDFHPDQADSRVAPIARRVIDLARDHGGLSRYEVLEIHLVRFVTGKQPEQITIEHNVAELTSNGRDE